MRPPVATGAMSPLRKQSEPRLAGDQIGHRMHLDDSAFLEGPGTNEPGEDAAPHPPLDGAGHGPRDRAPPVAAGPRRAGWRCACQNRRVIGSSRL